MNVEDTMEYWRARCEVLQHEVELLNNRLAQIHGLVDGWKPHKRGVDGFCHTCGAYTCSESDRSVEPK